MQNFIEGINKHWNWGWIRGLRNVTRPTETVERLISWDIYVNQKNTINDQTGNKEDLKTDALKTYIYKIWRKETKEEELMKQYDNTVRVPYHPSQLEIKKNNREEEKLFNTSRQVDTLIEGLLRKVKEDETNS